MLLSRSVRRISTREYVENALVKSILKRLFEILNPGVVVPGTTGAYSNRLDSTSNTPGAPKL